MEKLKRLNTYLQKMNDKLNDKIVPEKHKDHPESYKRFLNNEIRMTKLQIDAIMLNSQTGGK